MSEDFTHFIAEKKLCNRKDKILLAVSGGKDSMAMLHVFLEHNFQVSVAHVNFQLRGKESDNDEKFVEKFCERKFIPFYSKRFNTKKFANENDLSIQMAARKLRYDWFQQLVDQYHFDVVATGHHVTDSIETMLLNFTRGSGLEGWDGIAAKNKNIIRPLLFATRKQIDNYVEKNKIKWREDKSNATEDYPRNYIRHKILPHLKKLNPSLENSFIESMEKIASRNEFSEIGFNHWKEKFLKKKDNQFYVSKEGFKSHLHPEGLLWNLIKNYGFNFDQCQQVIRSMDEQSGKRFISKKYELVIDRDELIISIIGKELHETKIEKDQAHTMLGEYTLKISQKKQTKILTSNTMALLDFSKLQFPLVWRTWKSGDQFYPLGMNHKKKISDFLIDQKISVAQKKKTTVLVSGDDIVWLVGNRISEHFKVTNETKKILLIELTN